MGRLAGRGLPGRLGAAPSRVAQAPERRTEPGGDAWRKWYSTARWARLRRKVLARDLWTCQATGVALVSGRTAPNAAVVDHIRPHRGNPALFWDERNLRAVCKQWHDSEKQRLEKRGLA